MISFIVRAMTGLLVCFASIAFAVNNAIEPSSKACPSSQKHYRTTIRHIEGGGIGYNKGYTTLEAFLAPDPGKWPVMPFLDARGHLFDDGKWATNAGVGFRAILGSRAYGFNTYYDYRNTHRWHYNQIGIGLETLGTLWDIRINGYLPVGKKISAPYHTKFADFSGHHMILSQKRQFAMKGADAELGFHFGKTQLFDFYAAAGPYYYKGPLNHNAWGGKVRLAGMYKDYITLEISDSYDTAFHNNFQGQLSFTLPFGSRSRVKKTKGVNSCKIADVLNSRMLQPVGREEIVVVDHKRKHTIATNPSNGQPLFFVFVDNTSHSDGTFNSPYPTLALAEANSKPGDIIYVFPGNGTTTGMDAGINLQANQKLWGTGISQSIQTAQGNFTIPALSSSIPIMTNTSGDGVTLSTNNQISGMNLTNVAGNGIIGSDPENVQILTCTISSSQSHHINLNYSTSSGSALLDKLTLTNSTNNAIFIEADTATSTAISISNSNILSNQNGGLHFLLNEASSTELTLINNTMIGNTATDFTGQCIMIDTIGTIGQCNLGLINNTISQNPTNAALYVFNASGGSFTNLQAVLEGNVITSNGTNVLFDTPCDSFTLMATHNNISNSLGAGNPGLIVGPESINTANILIANNQINQNAADGITIICTPCNELILTVADNVICNNQGSGINQFTYPIITNETVTLTNNTISSNLNIPDIDNGAGGISLLGFDNMMATITNNTFINNAIGFTNNSSYIGAIDAVGSSTLNVDVSHNTFENTNLAFNMGGSYGTTSNSLGISNNTFSNNIGVNGIALDLSPTGSFGTLTATIENNISTSNSSGFAINVNPTNPAYSIPIIVSGNTIDNNTAFGIILTVENGTIIAAFDNNTLNNNIISPTFQAVTSSGSLCLEMHGNSSDTGYALNNNGGTFNLAPCNVTTVNAGMFSFPESPVINVQSCPGATHCP
ncbi:MAG: inverse autotransporter beta domain-containing protein [Anaerolineae bacterium]